MPDLLNLFNETPPNNASAQKLPMPSQGTEDEGWAAVEIPSNRQGPPKVDLPTTPQALPQLDAPLRPDMLFLQQLSYHMTLKMSRKGIVVDGSHRPSLELLSSYFSRWTRTLRNDSRSVRKSVP